MSSYNLDAVPILPPIQASDYFNPQPELKKSIASHLDELQAMGGGALGMAGTALGIEGLQKAGQEIYNRNMEESQAGWQRPAVPRVEDVRFSEPGGAGRALDFALYQGPKAVATIGEALGGGWAGGALAKGLAKARMASTVGAAAEQALQKQWVKGAVAGSLGTNAAMESSQAFGQMVQDGATPENSLLPALAYGAASSATEAVPGYLMAKHMGWLKPFKDKVRKEILGDAALSNAAVKLAQSKLGKFAKGVVAGGTAEGLQEGTQQLLQIAAERVAKDDPVFASLSDEDKSAVLNSFVVGALGGGLVGGPIGLMGGQGRQSGNTSEASKALTPTVISGTQTPEGEPAEGKKQWNYGPHNGPDPRGFDPNWKFRTGPSGMQGYGEAPLEGEVIDGQRPAPQRRLPRPAIEGEVVPDPTQIGEVPLDGEVIAGQQRPGQRALPWPPLEGEVVDQRAIEQQKAIEQQRKLAGPSDQLTTPSIVPQLTQTTETPHLNEKIDPNEWDQAFGQREVPSDETDFWNQMGEKEVSQQETPDQINPTEWDQAFGTELVPENEIDFWRRMGEDLPGPVVRVDGKPYVTQQSAEAAARRNGVDGPAIKIKGGYAVQPWTTPPVRPLSDKAQLNPTEPLGRIEQDPRLQDPEVRARMRQLADQAGWEQDGGRIIRDASGKVVDRTKWLPKRDWWINRPRDVKPHHVQSGMTKVEKGEPLQTRERRAVAWLASMASADLHEENPTKWGLGAPVGAQPKMPTAPTQPPSTPNEIPTAPRTTAIIVSPQRAKAQTLGFDVGDTLIFGGRETAPPGLDGIRPGTAIAVVAVQGNDVVQLATPANGLRRVSLRDLESTSDDWVALPGRTFEAEINAEGQFVVPEAAQLEMEALSETPNEEELQQAPGVMEVAQKIRADSPDFRTFSARIAAAFGHLGEKARQWARTLWKATGKVMLAAIMYVSPNVHIPQVILDRFAMQPAAVLSATQATVSPEVTTKVLKEAQQPIPIVPNELSPKDLQDAEENLRVYVEDLKADVKENRVPASTRIDGSRQWANKATAAMEKASRGERMSPLENLFAMYGLVEGQNKTLQQVLEAFGIKADQTTYPWCAAVMSYVHNRAGVLNGNKPFNILNSRGFLEVGQKVPLEDAQEGDVVVLRNGNPKTGGWHGFGGHALFFLKQQGNIIWGLGGNQSDQVNVMMFHKDQVLGVRRTVQPKVRLAENDGVKFGKNASRKGLTIAFDSNDNPVTTETDPEKSEVFRVVTKKNGETPVYVNPTIYDINWLRESAREEGKPDDVRITVSPKGRIEYAWKGADATHLEMESLVAKQKRPAPSNIRHILSAQNKLFGKNAPLWRSTLAEAIQGIDQRRASGAQWINMLTRKEKDGRLVGKLPGVKIEEIEDLGLVDWLEAQPGVVTKDQVEQFVRDGGVRVEEVLKGPKDTAAIESMIASISDKIQEVIEQHDAGLITSYEMGSTIDNLRRERRQLNEKLENNKKREDDRKFGQYQVPGGKNYRELLITIPGGEYSSSHWSEKGVLVHLRFNERTDADGKRVLFVEEVQSDLQQEYRKGKHNISAPMKQTSTWAMLGMKRAIKWAVDNGFDRVAWTPGEVQAERYDLSKQIDELLYEKKGDNVLITAYPIQENAAPISKRVPISEVDTIVGKELAEKISRDEGEQVSVTGTRRLSGLDLRVGGEGMRGFYDKMLPNEVGKWAKKFGGKVEQTRLAETASDASRPIATEYAQGKKPLMAFDIPDAMRAEAQRGMPLYGQEEQGQVVGQVQTPTTRARLEKVLHDLIGQSSHWRVHMHETAPAGVDSTTYGWVQRENGKYHVHFILDRIEQGTELSKFLHEVGGHLGIDGLLAPGERKRLVGAIREWAQKEGMEGDIARAALRRVEAAGTPTADQDSELIAYFLEEAVQRGVTPTAKGGLGEWFRTLWAAFKRALQRMGLKGLDGLTPQSIVDLAYGMAGKELGRAAEGNLAPEGVRYGKLYTGPSVGPDANLNPPGYANKVLYDYINGLHDLKKLNPKMESLINRVFSKRGSVLEHYHHDKVKPFTDKMADYKNLTGKSDEEVNLEFAARHVASDQENHLMALREAMHTAIEFEKVLRGIWRGLAQTDPLRAELGRLLVAFTKGRANLMKGWPWGWVVTAQMRKNKNIQPTNHLTNRQVQEKLVEKLETLLNTQLSNGNELWTNFNNIKDMRMEWEALRNHGAGLQTKGTMSQRPSVRTAFEQWMGPVRMTELARLDADTIWARAQSQQHSAKFLDLARRLDEVAADIRDQRVRGRLSTPEQATAMATDHPHWVPLRRESYDFEDVFGGTEASSRRMKARFGTPKIDPPVHVYQNAFAALDLTVTAAEANLARIEMADTLSKDPSLLEGWFEEPTSLPDTQKRYNKQGFAQYTWKPHDKYSIPFLRDGDPWVIPIVKSNERAQVVSAAIQNLAPMDQRAVMTLFKNANKFLRWVIISANPAFTLTNAPKDFLHAMMTIQAGPLAKYAKEITASYPECFMELWRHFVLKQPSQTILDMEKAGGRITFIESLRPNDRGFGSVEKSVAWAQGGKVLRPEMTRGLRNFLHMIEDVNIAVESVMRLAVWKAGKRHQADLGVTDDELGSLCKDVTVNYDRRGLRAHVVNAFYMFYNASVQGVSGILDAAANGPNRARFFKAIGGVMTAAFLADLVGAALSPGWDDTPEDQKDRFARIPGSDLVLPGDTMAKIPLPWVFNVVWRAGEMLGEMVRGRLSPDRYVAKLIELTINSTNPIGGNVQVAGEVGSGKDFDFGAPSVMTMLTPSALDWFTQIQTNRDPFGRPLGPEKLPGEKYKPESEMSWDNTPKFYKWVARELNAWTGGSQGESGLLDWRPSTYKTLVDTIGGGLGQVMTGLLGTAWGVAQLNPPPINRVPGAKSFLFTPSGQVGSGLYHERVARVEQARAAEKVLQGQGTQGRPDLEALRASKSLELRIAPALDDTERQITDLRKQMKEALKRGQDSRVEVLRERIKKAQRRFNQVWERRAGG